jgi:low affinity Fe/Cu permease
MAEAFRKVAHRVSAATGSAWAFLAAVVLIIGWALMGPLFHFSDVWQLVINTSTTIITFLMVFLIQNTQNRDSQALHLKLDELLHAVTGARNGMMDLEDLSDRQLGQLQAEFVRLRQDADAVAAPPAEHVSAKDRHKSATGDRQANPTASLPQEHTPMSVDNNN